MIQDLTLEMFAARKGERFRVRASDQLSFDVELVDASPLGARHPTLQREPFALVFRAAGGELVPQQIYRVEHDGMGAYDLFLVPIGRDGTAIKYEAVFT